MPELPEVETIRKGLINLLPGLEIKSIKFDWPKSFPNDKAIVDAYMVNAKVLDVRRRAKVLIIDLSTGYSLIIHLKMTGQVVFRSPTVQFGAGHPGESLVAKLPDKSTRVVITFKQGSKLFFNDQRKFGWVKLLPKEDIEKLEFFIKLGPEPLGDDFSPKVLAERLKRRSKTSVKAALLDQSVVAGIGNIYADESLWGAKINPARVVGKLTKKDIENLYKEIVFVLKLSLDKGGSTDKNYVDAEGKKGSYLKFARVFRREGQACPRCGNIIVKNRVARRGTHFCPVCQSK